MLFRSLGVNLSAKEAKNDSLTDSESINQLLNDIRNSDIRNINQIDLHRDIEDLEDLDAEAVLSSKISIRRVALEGVEAAIKRYKKKRSSNKNYMLTTAAITLIFCALTYSLYQKSKSNSTSGDSGGDSRSQAGKKHGKKGRSR